MKTITLRTFAFSDEAIFHTSGKVNRHNVRIWGLENPRVVFENERDSPKVNVWCALMHNKVIGPFFFLAHHFSNCLPGHDGALCCTSEEFQPQVVLQQDGTLPHWGLLVRQFLDATFSNRWTGRDGPTPWPPRSPDITPLDFFLWGYVKDKVYSTPVPGIDTLEARIRDALAAVTEDVGENMERNLV
jgi:hypothetical protein